MRKILSMMLFAFTITTISLNASKKIVVNLSTQTATAYENGHAVFSGQISSGTAKRPTPRGTFRVLAKERYHRSTSWPKPNGGAKMNYMLRLTDYGIAMHLGYVPNYPASHGCIRMENGFAQRMFSWARVGTKVKVTGYGPRRVNRVDKSTRVALTKKAKRMPIINSRGRVIKRAKTAMVPKVVKSVKYTSLDILNGQIPKTRSRRTLLDAMRAPRRTTKAYIQPRPLQALSNR